MIAQIATVVFVYIGIIFILISAVGIIRMPDVYCRMSVVAKSVAMGIGLILIGVIIHFNTTSILLKAAIIFIFLMFSLSVAAHVIGLAAYMDKTPLSRQTFLDELASKYKKSEQKKG